jgi:hypothetical protein
MACRQCGEEKTIRAHVLPRAIGLLARGQATDLNQIAEDSGRPSKTGPWDPDILCASHDGWLGAYDRYAVEFLVEHQHRDFGRVGTNFAIENVDTDKLVRFTMAVAWRASISRRTEFQFIRLGPYEERFRLALFDPKPLPAGLIEMVMIRYRSERMPLHQLIEMPFQRKMDGAHFFTFNIVGWCFLAKIGRGPMPRILHPAVIVPARNGKIASLVDDFDTSPALESLVDIAARKRARRASAKREDA